VDIVALILIGAVAGTLAGLLGIGGGAIIVPVLVVVFEHQGVATGPLMQAAIGTSMATIFFTAVSATLAHQRRGSIHWQTFWHMTPGVVIGALVGVSIAHWLPSKALKLLFGAFLLLIAVRMAWPTLPHTSRPMPSRRWLAAVGGSIGILSSLFGIGGASMSIPFLTWCGLSAAEVVGTSAAMGIPIAAAGTAGYIVAGFGAANLPPLSVGYIVLPAFGGIVIASTLFAPLGARLAHRVSPATLRRLFAVLLVIFGLRLLLG
jgi:uncharacterized membrane protein YfcA